MRADLVSRRQPTAPGAPRQAPAPTGGGNGTGEVESRGNNRGLIDVLAVFLEQAPIHYNGQSGPLSLLGRFPMNDALLHPDGSDPHLYGLLDHQRDGIRTTEDIDQIDWGGRRNIQQTGIAEFSQDCLVVGIYRNDSVAWVCM